MDIEKRLVERIPIHSDVSMLNNPPRADLLLFCLLLDQVCHFYDYFELGRWMLFKILIADATAVVYDTMKQLQASSFSFSTAYLITPDVAELVERFPALLNTFGGDISDSGVINRCPILSVVFECLVLSEAEDKITIM